ncbi:MAG: helix-turn-helix transcriptional regulator [Deltaproteobacteria bacterium]|nr:helix-turn-helix transcriptional regulator [Deltaproteobacteria bacterium]
MDVIGEWWTLLIIRDLFYGINTFDMLIKDLNISRNILTDRLKKLLGRGLIEKRSKEKRLRRKAYHLTPKGEDLFPIIMALVSWGDRWEAPQGPPIIFQHQPDGHLVHSKVICSHCGEVLKPKDIKPAIGPGAKRLKSLPMTLRPHIGKDQLK